MNEKISIEPIGYIETKYQERKGTPPQGRESKESYGTICMRSEFVDGIRDLKEGMEITIIFNFHKSKDYKLITEARLSPVPLGVFATRSPDRPNRIGITDVKIKKIGDGKIEFIGADMLDGTPVIDIKPSFSQIYTK